MAKSEKKKTAGNTIAAGHTSTAGKSQTAGNSQTTGRTKTAYTVKDPLIERLAGAKALADIAAEQAAKSVGIKIFKTADSGGAFTESKTRSGQTIAASSGLNAKPRTSSLGSKTASTATKKNSGAVTDNASGKQSFFQTLLGVQSTSANAAKEVSRTIANRSGLSVQQRTNTGGNKTAGAKNNASHEGGGAGRSFVTFEPYTADNLDKRWNRMLELARKDSLTEAEKEEAAAAYKAIKKFNRQNMFTEVVSGWNYPHSFADYATLEAELGERSDKGWAALTGAVDAFPFSDKITDWSNQAFWATHNHDSVYNGMSDEIRALSEKSFEASIREKNDAIKTANPDAYTAGYIAGDLAYLLMIDGLTGGLLEPVAEAASDSRVASLGVKALQSALTFGVKNGTQAAGEQDWSDAWSAIKATGKAAENGAAVGVVGGLLSGLTSMGISDVIEKYGLESLYTKYIQQVLSSTAFGGGAIGTEYLLAPEEEKPTVQEMGRQFKTVFLFSLVSAGINALISSNGTSTDISSENNLTSAETRLYELRDELLDLNGKLDTEAGAARALEITNDMREIILGQADQGKSIGATIDWLDMFDEYVKGAQSKLSGYASVGTAAPSLLSEASENALISSDTGGLTLFETMPYAAEVPPVAAITGTDTLRPGTLNTLTPAQEWDVAYRAYLAALIEAENRRVPNAVMQNAKAIMPWATEEKIQENYERYLRENEQENAPVSESLDWEDAKGYNIDNAEPAEQPINLFDSIPEYYKCINEKLAGKTHPVTGVPFVQRQVTVDDSLYSVVVPAFDSYYDVQLPDTMLESRDPTQFAYCNRLLKQAVAEDPQLRALFTEQQLEDIESVSTPQDFAWHHDAESGMMQLVDRDEHKQTGHTGGRAIWGGGSEKRRMIDLHGMVFSKRT